MPLTCLMASSCPADICPSLSTYPSCVATQLMADWAASSQHHHAPQPSESTREVATLMSIVFPRPLLSATPRTP